jgi:GNAT superfamily N-acetyltransferase
MQRLATADEWWAQDFGCAPGELRPPSARVQAHTARLAEATGIWLLVAGGAPVVSMPADVFASHGERAKAWTAALVADEASLLRELSGLAPGRVGKVIGPAFIGYGSTATLTLDDAARAVAIPSQQANIAALRHACGAAWDDGGSQVEEGVPLFGVFDDPRELIALASYEVWNESIAHISIVTHPQHRRRGLGRAAVALAAQHALAAGLVPQYRTLQANTASIAIAKRLGFVEYGFSVYVRMQPA